MSNVHYNKSLLPGRCVILQTDTHHYIPALLLRHNSDQSHTALVLCNHGNNPPISLVDSKSARVVPYSPINALHVPSDGSSSHTLLKVKGRDIVTVLKKMISLDIQKILRDCENREIPRFK